MNIAEAAKVVLQDATAPMSAADIYAEIVKRDLFQFGAKDPKSVVAQTLRKRSDANPKAKTVLFRLSSKGMYELA